MIDTESAAWRQTRLLVEILPFVSAEEVFELHNLGEMDLERHRRAVRNLEQVLERIGR